MDPCPFYRIRVGNLALKLPSRSPPSSSPPSSLLNLQTPSSSSFFYCKIRFADFPLQVAAVPVAAPDSAAASSATGSACFTLSKPDLDRLLASQKRKKKKTSLPLNIDVYRRSGGKESCGFGFGSGKFVGRVSLELDLGRDGQIGSLQNGWIRIGKGKNCEELSELFVSVKFDADPRFVFEFDGESECSPQVFQVQGSIKQPVFSCKFGFKNSGDYNLRSSSSSSEPTTSSRCWGSDHHRRSHDAARERKGWTVTIHDLSGSPVAAASIITPFVPSPGSDRVSRSNPGAWLILRPADGTWSPWGRLEAWSDRSSTVNHRFEILSGAGAITLSSGAVDSRSGGDFSIDIGGPGYNSPAASPSGSFDLSSWTGSGSDCGSGSGSGSGSGWCWGPQWMYKGFVMSTTVGGERAHVQVGAQHVTCAEDAAAFVALAAAADLSVDACKPFSQRLRKELRQPSGDVVA